MAKKTLTWGFVEQPRLFTGGDVIHREFIAGRKSDYVIELGSSETLRHRSSVPHEMMAVVHLPLGTLGHQVFERVEGPNPGPGETRILQGLMHVVLQGGRVMYSPAYLHTKDDRVIGALGVRGRKLWQVKVAKPVREEAFALVKERLAAWDDLTLCLPEEPLIEVPTRKGKSWMWSARWRELHADPKGRARPVGLNLAGNSWPISSEHRGSVSR